MSSLSSTLSTTTWYPNQLISTANTIQWNGSTIRVVSSPTDYFTPTTTKKEEGPVEWLRRRVDEMRVDLMAA